MHWTMTYEPHTERASLSPKNEICVSRAPERVSIRALNKQKSHSPQLWITSLDNWWPIRKKLVPSSEDTSCTKTILNSGQRSHQLFIIIIITTTITIILIIHQVFNFLNQTSPLCLRVTAFTPNRGD